MVKPSKKPVRCYIALGSNMGDSLSYLQQAISDLNDHPHISSLIISRFYKSKPHGPQDQPDYLNGAVSVETTLDPETLLDAMQKIENDNDRVREGVKRWGARTLDLDLLFYGDQEIDSRRLIVPHPRICERSFVLYPLRDLIKDTKDNLTIDKSTTIEDCINNLSDIEKNNIMELDHA
ncbi:2-amino-4-hydroxy-6-hydroxymethyldihydropteridine diphosphokinase [Cocleimonas flava]|uniref:2-amino-4-hydroxy-6-hydroxymethyldihydropteridine pyrophosphokinase n=1 Tax=Cocleimonas flava TaxID=634765 RepID=A0A4R1F9C3_9GAMM|nr:2-amino-4-hydroxy-6-hydroxymethyldihydropteridine diphosphokinase [Cocleimonas flava]TCJ89374.1 2-amino-4-hydroxy-6-hydroxymethyldihydropteridine diphosphokinase [Cocleimonas flava]